MTNIPPSALLTEPGIGSALANPADPTRQGAAQLISLRDMEVRSEESEARMAAAYAPSMRLTSSKQGNLAIKGYDPGSPPSTTRSYEGLTDVHAGVDGRNVVILECRESR